MKCFFCGGDETQVIETRLCEDKISIKRRRKCSICDKRFNTIEMIDVRMPVIIKTSGAREDYNEEKIRKSIMLALHKRSVSSDKIDKAIDTIRQKILQFGEREVSSRKIGDLIMQQLVQLDSVAYIRFASVYRSFKDVTDFSDIIEQVFPEK
jgi:transcriptional repressor NrdR